MASDTQKDSLSVNINRNPSMVTQEDFLNLKTLLKEKGKLSFQVVTGSMEPLIATGSPIEVEPLLEDPKIYDILVFLLRGRLICHYVWYVNSIPSFDGESTVTTRSLKGGTDFPVAMAQVLGRVKSHHLGTWTKIRLTLRSRLFR